MRLPLDAPPQADNLLLGLRNLLLGQALLGLLGVSERGHALLDLLLGDGLLDLLLRQCLLELLNLLLRQGLPGVILLAYALLCLLERLGRSLLGLLGEIPLTESLLHLLLNLLLHLLLHLMLGQGLLELSVVFLLAECLMLGISGRGTRLLELLLPQARKGGLLGLLGIFPLADALLDLLLRQGLL